MEELKDNVMVKAEWFFIYKDGSNESVLGPFSNWITSTGLAQIAASGVENMASPYLVVGDDSTQGETIVEAFRKDVSIVSRSGSTVRIRTVLLPSECNGNHQKASIFFGATEAAGSGTMLNLLVQPWSKTANDVVTVEVRITISAG